MPPFKKEKNPKNTIGARLRKDPFTGQFVPDEHGDYYTEWFDEKNLFIQPIKNPLYGANKNKNKE